MAQQQPYGDIFYVQTPTLDRWSQQLYQEQKIREAKQYQENAALDAGISKELGKVRSVDAPEIIKDYHDLKQIRKQLYFDKKLHNDPVAYNQLQQQGLQKYQSIVSKSNASAEIKDMAKTMNADHFKNPWSYVDDYGQRLATLNNTPISQLNNHPVYGNDLLNMDKYRYDGSNVDFSKKLRDATGQPRNISGKEEALDKQGIQFRTPVYQYANSPARVFDSLMGSMDHQTERAAQVNWKRLSPDEIQRTEDQYNSIPQTKWEQMGEAAPQQLNIRGGSDAEKYMRYLAQRSAIDTNPTLLRYDKRTSDKAKMDYEFGQKKVLENIEFGHRKELKQDEQNKVDDWVVNYWKERFNEARTTPPKAITSDDPRNQLANRFKIMHQLNPDQIMMEALKKSGVYPDDVYVTKDDKLLPVFYKYKNITNDKGTVIGTEVERDKKGKKIIDEDLTTPMGLDQAYLSMGYKGKTKKDLGGSMSDVYNKNVKPSSTRKYSVDGKTYTHDELLKNGYTEDKIKQYIDAGILK